MLKVKLRRENGDIYTKKGSVRNMLKVKLRRQNRAT